MDFRQPEYEMSLGKLKFVVCFFLFTISNVWGQTNSYEETYQLKFSDFIEGAEGHSLSVHGNYAAIGAPEENGHGAVYVFEKDANGVWQQIQILMTPISVSAGGPQQGASFGHDVAISDEVLIVGEPFRDSSSVANRGRAYLYTPNTDPNIIGWKFLNRIEGINSFDELGKTVAASENLVAYSTGSGNGTDVRVEEVVGSNTLITTFTSSSDGFGSDIALLDGDFAAIAITDPGYDNGAGLSPGAVFLYRQGSTGWLGPTIAAQPSGANSFGSSVAIGTAQPGLLPANVGPWPVVLIGDDGHDRGFLSPDVGAIYSYYSNYPLNGSGAGTSNDWITDGTPVVTSNASAFDGVGRSLDMDGDIALAGSDSDQAYQYQFSFDAMDVIFGVVIQVPVLEEQRILVPSDNVGALNRDFSHAVGVVSDEEFLVGGPSPNDSGVYVYDIVEEECNGLNITVNIGAGETPTANDDVILGTSGADFIDAGAGDDTICGMGGADMIFAGGGMDYVEGGNGADLIFGEGGNDTIFGGPGGDEIDGGGGDDEIFGEGGGDVLVGRTGEDILDGGTGVDSISGGPQADTIFTGSGATVGTGLFVSGGGAADTIFGGPDADDLRGAAGADIIHGGDDNDVITGGIGLDELFGGNGDDVIRGQGNRDDLFGEAGNDELTGGAGDDDLDGGPGSDSCAGQAGTGDTAVNCESESTIP